MIEDLWYKNSVIYNIDLETYLDANGDGTGDFEGLMRRLEYLQSLGVNTLWLSPFQPTPNRDNGYDVYDHYGVDPRHGSSGDFVEFMHRASNRGINVIIDLVVNHTSDQHRWFQQARADPQSRYRDWYIWSRDRPSGWQSGIVFPGVQEATWDYDRRARSYYFHRFYKHQPDLNMDNPAVRREVCRIMGYWLQLGVAGFRMDAVPFVLETTQPGKQQGKQHFEYLQEFRSFLQWRSGDAILLGEANVTPDEARNYFGSNGQGMHLMFNFFVNQFLFYALATGEAEPLAEALEATRAHPPGAQWAHFLRNHDELDLGRLSDEQRARVFERFAPDEHMRLYGRGIRRRLAPMLGDRRLIELAYSLLLSLPGTPVLYYGDEIGMGDDLSLPEREPVRTPMQWTNEECAGFSMADSTIRPVVASGPYDYKQINVEAQRRDPGSLMNWLTHMIHLRHECPEIGWGTWQIVPTGNPRILALCYEWQARHVVVIHNFDAAPHEVQVTLEVPGGDSLFDLRVDTASHADTGGTHRILLEAYAYRWFRVGSLNYALNGRS